MATTKKERMREHLTDTFGKPNGDAPIGDKVKLFQQHMPWPDDLHAYYDKLDRERGIEPPKKLIQGYGKGETQNGRPGKSI